MPARSAPGDHHPRPQAPIRPAEQPGHEEEERQGDREDRPPAQELLARGQAVDEVEQRLAGEQDDADDEQQAARRTARWCDSRGRVYGGIMRRMPSRPGSRTRSSDSSAGGCRRRAERCASSGLESPVIDRPRPLGHPAHRGHHRRRRMVRARLLPRPGSRLPAGDPGPRRSWHAGGAARRRCAAGRSAVADVRLPPRGARAACAPRRRRRRDARGLRGRHQRRAHAASARPHELVLLRAGRTSGQVEDVLAFIGLQSLALAGNWDAELARLAILMADGPDALDAADERLRAVAAGGRSAAGPARGRRSIASRRTWRRCGGIAGGAAAGRTPGRWPRRAPRLGSADPRQRSAPGAGRPGAVVPGAPAHAGVGGGRRLVRRRPGWCRPGTTATSPGASPPAAPTRPTCSGRRSAPTGTARGPDGDEPVDAHPRGDRAYAAAPTVIEEVIVTPRGPIVTAGPGRASAWRSRCPRRGWSRAAVPRLARRRNAPATSPPSARRSRAWPGPALNVVYADAEGHIGWQLIGTLPAGAPATARCRAPAWEAGWEDEHLPFDAMPSAHDPERRLRGSGEQRAADRRRRGPFLGVDWLDGYRAAAIVEALGERDDWDVAARAPRSSAT